MILPRGLDDLQHGVEALLAVNDEIESRCAELILSDAGLATLRNFRNQRETAANIITESIGGMNSASSSDLVLEVQRLAAWGGDSAPVHAAWLKVLVDYGPWIGAKQGESQRAILANAKSREAAGGKQDDILAKVSPLFEATYNKTMVSRKRVGRRELARLARLSAKVSCIASDTPDEVKPDLRYFTEHYAGLWLKRRTKTG